MISRSRLLLILAGLVTNVPLWAETPTQEKEPVIASGKNGTKPQSPTSGAIITKPIHIKMNTVQYNQYPVAQELEDDRLSGYEAFKNLLIAAPSIDASPEILSILEKELLSGTYRTHLFKNEHAEWPRIVSTGRASTLAAEYIEDTLYQSIRSSRKITYESITSMDVSPLNLDEKHVISYDNYRLGTEKEKKITEKLVRLTKTVAAQLTLTLTEKLASEIDSIVLSQQAIFKAFEQEAQKLDADAKFPTISIDTAILSEYFPSLTSITFSLKRGINTLTLSANNKDIYSRSFGPESKRETFNGAWLTESDFKNLAQHIQSDAATSFEKAILSSPVHALDFSKDASAQVTQLKCMFLINDLQLHTSCLVFIKKNDHWYSCCVQKKDNTFHMTVTDSRNEDRSTDAAIKQLARSLNDEQKRAAEPKKTADQKKKEETDLLASLLDPKPKQEAAKTEEETNYDAPCAKIPLEELPSLKDLVGDKDGKLPNYIELLTHQLKAPARAQSAGTRAKNAFIFTGPPGTGKSTLVQVLARSCDLEVVYAGGGDFRTAYQGSSKVKLDALFEHAKKVRDRTGKRVAIMIDEIDGTSSKIEPRNSTEEDNRAIKSLITTLDQHRYDTDIFFFGTTNYPDKIDPAILRRFTTIEIPLPSYDIRKKVIQYYCKLNGLKIADANVDEHSATPTTDIKAALSETFLEELTIATEGLSNDAIMEIINKAVQEADFGLQPELSIPLGFRTGIDIAHRPVLSSVGALAAAPFIALGHYTGLTTNTELEKHIAAQVTKQWKIKNDIDRVEAENDPIAKSEKLLARRESVLRRWGKSAGYMMTSGFLGGVGGTALTLVVGAIAHKNGWFKDYLRDGRGI